LTKQYFVFYFIIEKVFSYLLCTLSLGINHTNIINLNNSPRVATGVVLETSFFNEGV
jgi:hypothetical protein